MILETLQVFLLLSVYLACGIKGLISAVSDENYMSFIFEQ